MKFCNYMGEKGTPHCQYHFFFCPDNKITNPAVRTFNIFIKNRPVSTDWPRSTQAFQIQNSVNFNFFSHVLCLKI